MKRWTADQYIEGVLAGDRQSVSRAITLAESTLATDQAIARTVIQALSVAVHNRHSEGQEPGLPSQTHPKGLRVGLTGVPGVGKSTFIEVLGLQLAQAGQQVAVLAVDPSSQIGKGSLLGDKTRMEELSRSPNVFIRPSPTSGSLGGVTAHTREAILICEAAGFDVILVETVGVGQSEVAVRGLCDVFMLLMLPGAGDELQGMKRGIMEMADLLVITKAEANNKVAARLAQVGYQNALHLFPPPGSGQSVPVLLSSALDPDTIAEVWQAVLHWQTEAIRTGWWDKQRQHQQLQAFRQQLEARILDQFYSEHLAQVAQAEAQIRAGADVSTALGLVLPKSTYLSH